MLLKPVSFLKKSAAVSSGFTRAGGGEAGGNGPTYTLSSAAITDAPAAGDRVVILFAWLNQTLSSVAIDPAGSNTAATIRHTSGSTYRSAIVDVAWPSSGALDIAMTMSSASFGRAYFSVWKGPSTLAYADGSAKAETGTFDPGFAVITDTFTAGDAAIAGFCGDILTGQSITSGFDSITFEPGTDTNLWVGVDDAATGSSTDYQITATSFKTYSAVIAAYN